MDLGSNFAAKLEPFLLMGKAVKGAAAAKLIQDATSAPGVFVFSELLELSNIQELAKHEQHQKFFALLEVFSYKTYQEYLQNKDTLPPLNTAQTIKLKHLSIVSLAASRRILPYTELLQALDMPNVRELEDLIIDAIYLDILRGKLDQNEGQLEIEYTMGRDLEPGSLELMLEALKDWATTTAAVLDTLDKKIASISSESAAQKLAQEEHDKALQATLKDIVDKQKDRSNSIGGILPRKGFFSSSERDRGHDRDNMRMEIDEAPPEMSKGKGRKYVVPSWTGIGPDIQPVYLDFFADG